MSHKPSWDKRARRVRKAWEMFKDAEPDISTERLIAMIADATGEDYGDVATMIADSGEAA